MERRELRAVYQMTHSLASERMHMASPSPVSSSVGPRPLAATSWLWPGSLGSNLGRMARWELPIRQAALLFYQFAPSLAYAEADYAPGRGLDCHAHLPLDLPWGADPRYLWNILERLMRPPGPLAPWAGVLHPPGDPADLAALARLWRGREPGWRLLIENVPGQDLSAHWPVIREFGLGVCLDVGHLMAFGQDWLLDAPELPELVELTHCYAPGVVSGSHEHLALNMLTPSQTATLERIVRLLRPNTPVLFEVFSEIDLRESLKTFYEFLQVWGLEP